MSSTYRKETRPIKSPKKPCEAKLAKEHATRSRAQSMHVGK